MNFYFSISLGVKQPKNIVFCVIPQGTLLRKNTQHHHNYTYHLNLFSKNNK